MFSVGIPQPILICGVAEVFFCQLGCQESYRKEKPLQSRNLTKQPKELIPYRKDFLQIFYGLLRTETDDHRNAERPSLYNLVGNLLERKTLAALKKPLQSCKTDPD